MRIVYISAMILLFNICCQKANQQDANIESEEIKDEVTYEEPIPNLVDSTQLKKLNANEKAFLARCVTNDGSEDYYDQIHKFDPPYFVHYPNGGDPYTVYYTLLGSRDFNEDGVMDYLVQRTSEGALGGNSNNNKSFMYYIMQDSIQEMNVHEVIAYAPFSYNLLTHAEWKKDTLKALVSKNLRYYSEEDSPYVPVSFVYTNGNLYESSYLTHCRLAQLEKRIIFNDNRTEVSRLRTIDGHNFTEVIEETYEKNDVIIKSTLSGCDNLTLTFNTSFIVDTENFINTPYQKRFTLQWLDFLKKNTQFSEIISSIREHYARIPFTMERVAVSKVYEYQLEIVQSKYDTNIFEFSLIIEEIRNAEQRENWEVTTRKKEYIEVTNLNEE